MNTVAVVDDDVNAARMACWQVEEAGFEPLLINDKFDDPCLLAKRIKDKANGAICDHRLAYFGYANFSGASVVANLFDLRIPAILVTQFLDVDRDVSIRRFRRKIPILMSREDLDNKSIIEGLALCAEELKGNIASVRKKHRSLLRIEGMDKEGGEDVADAIVPAWNPKRAIRFPLSLLDDSVRFKVQIGTRFVASINIGAEKPEDIYIDEVELLPELSENDSF